MRPVHFDGQTAVLGAPPDWDEATHGSCEGLPVRRDPDGMFASYWRPSWRERLRLLFGGVVQLALVSAGHPPVMLDAVPKRKGSRVR